MAFVVLGFTGTYSYGLIDERLYLPEIWFSGEYKKIGSNAAYLPPLNSKLKINLLLI
jgi:hypothetical protein